MITMVKCLHGCSLRWVWWWERTRLALSLYLVWYRTTGIQPFAWVPLGVYIGLPPRGTMVIRLGTGPAISASDLRLLRRLLGPADWWAQPTGLVRSRQAASAAGGSCRLLITVAVLLMMQAWSWGRGNSPVAWRAITVATPHLFLINGAWASGEGSDDSPGPTPDGSDWWLSRRLPRSR